MWKSEKLLTVLYRSSSTATKKKEAVLKDIAYNYNSFEHRLPRGAWVTDEVFDVHFDIDVSLKRPVEGKIKHNIKSAIILVFHAEDGIQSPQVRMSRQTVGEHYYDFDDATQTFNLTNQLIIDLQEKKSEFINLAADLFRRKLLRELPNLELIKVEPESKEYGYMVRLRGVEDVIR